MSMSKKDVDDLLSRTKSDQVLYDQAETRAAHSLIFKWILVVTVPILIYLGWMYGSKYYRASLWKPYTYSDTESVPFVFDQLNSNDITIKMEGWRMVRQESDPDVWHFKYNFSLTKDSDVDIPRVNYWVDFKDSSGATLATATGTFSFIGFRRDIEGTVDFQHFPETGLYRSTDMEILFDARPNPNDTRRPSGNSY